MNRQNVHIDKTLEPCPLCLSSRLEELFSLEGEQFVRCNNCHLTHINPKPNTKTIQSTYLSGYSDSYQKKFVKKSKRAKRYVRRIKNKLGKKGRWLDIGCSAGFVVKASRDFGFEGFGIDIDPEGIAYARKRLDLSTVQLGTLEKIGFTAQSFDVISAYDVIEHVEDLHTFTAEMKRLLAPGGLIDLVTPNIGHWTVPRHLKLWKEIKPSEHLYYFNKENLSKLLHEHDLQIVQTRFSLKATLKVIVTHRKNELSKAN